MNGNFIMGRYLPGESFIHRLDARAKLIAGFYFIALVMMANRWETYMILTLYVGFMMKLAQVPMGFMMKGIKPLMKIIVFTMVLQLIFSRGGTLYFQLGPIGITQRGLVNAMAIFFRFTLTIMMSTIISLTTKPLDLTDAIHSLLSPLKPLQVPVEDFALMLSIALRFIPTLMDEGIKIMKAQQARGVEFGEGNVFEQMKKVIPIFLPLFVRSFYRAEELANALDIRGYQSNRRRSRLRIQKWRLRDTVFLLSYLCLTGFIVWI